MEKFKQLMIDIVLPKNNEEEFVNKAKHFRYKGLIFLYKVKNKDDIKYLKNTRIKNYNFPIYYGALIDCDDVKTVRELAAELFYSSNIFNDLVFVKARDFKFNRAISDIHFINGIVNPGYIDVEDRLHYRYVALSTISIKNLKKNNLCVVFSIYDLVSDQNDFPKYLGRIIYLSRILNKYKIPVVIASFSKMPEELIDPRILLSFKNLFKVKDSLKNVFYYNLIKQISRTRMAKNPFVFTKGFYIVKLPFEDCREF